MIGGRNIDLLVDLFLCLLIDFRNFRIYNSNSWRCVLRTILRTTSCGDGVWNLAGILHPRANDIDGLIGETDVLRDDDVGTFWPLQQTLANEFTLLGDGEVTPGDVGRPHEILLLYIVEMRDPAESNRDSELVASLDSMMTIENGVELIDGRFPTGDDPVVRFEALQQPLIIVR